MAKTRQRSVHPDIERARGRVELWRQERKQHGPMPEGLWHEAARLAHHHGVQAVAVALRLDYGRLKARVRGVDQQTLSAPLGAGEESSAEENDHGGVVEFVELRPVAAAPVPSSEQAEATIELTRADGSTLSIRLPVGGAGQDRLDLAAVTRASLGNGTCSS
jgi:hypothetical protein